MPCLGMDATQIWANLAVNDLKITTEFYSALGFKRNGAGDSTDLVSFFFAENEFVIHFFEKSKLEHNTGMKTADLSLGNEIMFSLSVTTEGAVYQWLENVKGAGGTIHREPARDEQGFFWFVFSDPDGHRFNVLLIESGM